MKKLCILLSLLFWMIDASAQIHTNCYFDGYWSDWELSPSFQAKGDFDNFIVYDESDGPWGYFLKVQIHDFDVIPKKQRKKDLKQTEIVKYEYAATVEYFLPDYGGSPNTTLYDLFKFAKKQFFWPQEPTGESQPPVKKVVSKAKVKVYTYEDYPQYYLLYFDNIGAGFMLTKNFFGQSKFNFDK